MGDERAFQGDDRPSVRQRRRNFRVDVKLVGHAG